MRFAPSTCRWCDLQITSRTQERRRFNAIYVMIDFRYDVTQQARLGWPKPAGPGILAFGSTPFEQRAKVSPRPSNTAGVGGSGSEGGAHAGAGSEEGAYCWYVDS